MKSKGYNWLSAIVIVILVITVVLMSQGFSDREYGPNLIVGFIGALISAVITLMLLRDQTKSEEERDKSIKMYENKLKAFAEFNRFLWEKDELDDERLRQSCMQNLIFYLGNDQIRELIKYAEIIKSSDNKGKREKAKAEILKMLKESLNENDKIDSESIKALSAILTPELGVSEIQHNRNEKTDSVQSDIANSPSSNVVDNPIVQENLKIDEINFEEIKKKYGISENATFWHFNALEPDKQAKRLKQPNPILSLIEYGESWRTERLQEVKPGDIIFLFYRGGPGYVGMYRALGTQVIKNLDITNIDSDVEIDCDGVKETKAFDNELRKNDIYEAIDDGGDYVANIFVEELSTREDKGNPCETVIRQTIARMSPDRSELLLKYFSE